MPDRIPTSRAAAIAPARLRLDVCCNDPDNGLFVGRADGLQLTTWDDALIELETRYWECGPRFTEKSGTIRIARRTWPILAAKEWYGNWCWNAYWLAPTTLLDLLSTVKKARQFHCTNAPTQLYENWNDDEAPLSRALWLANLWGRHSIGATDAC
jgi:hypothetical protein